MKVVRKLTKDEGGEVAERIEKLDGEEYKCSCGHTSYARTFLGYKHDGGTPDEEGTKWWLFIECPGCGHQHSLGKLKHHLTNDDLSH